MIAFIIASATLGQCANGACAPPATRYSYPSYYSTPSYYQPTYYPSAQPQYVQPSRVVTPPPAPVAKPAPAPVVKADPKPLALPPKEPVPVGDPFPSGVMVDKLQQSPKGIFGSEGFSDLPVNDKGIPLPPEAEAPKRKKSGDALAVGCGVIALVGAGFLAVSSGKEDADD